MFIPNCPVQRKIYNLAAFRAAAGSTALFMKELLLRNALHAANLQSLEAAKWCGAWYSLFF